MQAMGVGPGLTIGPLCDFRQFCLPLRALLSTVPCSQMAVKAGYKDSYGPSFKLTVSLLANDVPTERQLGRMIL